MIRAASDPARASLPRFALALVLTCTSAVSSSATDKSGEVSPYRVYAALARAKAGETIRLAPGDFGDVIIAGRKFASQVRIDASNARFTSLIIRGVAGVTIIGGTVVAPRESNFSVLIDNSSDLQLSHMAIAGGRIAVTVIRSHDIAISDNDFQGTRSDGVNVSMSQKVRIQRNLCAKFLPIPAVYDGKGKLVKDGDHPDCVQIWSVPDHPPTSDVVVTDNVAEGYMQGVFITNPAIGPEQPPFERVEVRNNKLRLAMFNGIVIYNVRDAIVRDNLVEPMPGAKMLNYPFGLIKPWIRVTGENNSVCSNVVASWPADPSNGRCPKH